MKFIYHESVTFPGYGWIEPIQDHQCPLIDRDTAQDIISQFKVDEDLLRRAQELLTHHDCSQVRKDLQREITERLND